MVQILKSYVGLGFGDEGKGNQVDGGVAFAKSFDEGKRTVVVRFQGGPNAGHTIYSYGLDGKLIEFITHAAPSGLIGNVDIAVGPSVAFDTEKFINELKGAGELFRYNGRVMISERAGILFDYHRKLDVWREMSGKKIGTTKSGIGPLYEDNERRTTRITFYDYISNRFHDKLKEVLKLKKLELSAAGILEEGIDKYCEKLIAIHDPIRKELAPFVERLEYRLREYLMNGDNIIIEGSQGTGLDVDMGSISDVTSSHLLAPYAFASLGLPRNAFKIYGVEKVYVTRVGEGVLPTLATDGFGDIVVKNAGEFGATTRRKRRVGYPDWVFTKRSAMLNDCDGIILTRVDVVQDLELKVCCSYDINGEIVEEVPLDLSTVKPIYKDKKFKWHLWDGPSDLSNPIDVDNQLKDKRKEYVEGGLEGLPLGLQNYIKEHDNYVGCPIIGASIGPSRGETVFKRNV
ncbi:MAG: adenylosuccinate synthetase [Nanoarchaeota archaeon]|nr:adenylosuccinate synthetase [Nanoarchaeota archaeon]